MIYANSRKKPYYYYNNMFIPRQSSFTHLHYYHYYYTIPHIVICAYSLYINKTRRAAVNLYITPFLSLFRCNRRSNRTATGCAGSWHNLRPSASNGAMSYRPISGTCRPCSTAGNVSYARRTNRNELWSESLPTKMAGCSRTSERFAFINMLL
jgi:hypothetical protein